MSEHDAKRGEAGGTDSATRPSSIAAPPPPDDLADAVLFGAADLVVHGVAPDLSVHAPFVDGDHDVASSAKKPRKTPHVPHAARPSLARAATRTPAPVAQAPYQLPPDVADKIAAMKASAFNAQLAVLRQNKAPNAKYQIGALLEGVGDAATRKHMRAQHAANNDGESFSTMLEHTDVLDEHGKKNAIGLMSTERDAATDKLAGMDPAKRADMEDQAAVWADKLAKAHRSSDRDDSEYADRVASILGPRTPEELELIRERVRLNTSGTEERTLHEELDRTFTGRDKDIAMARLGGDHVHVAATQLVDATMESDPERVHRIVKELGPEKLATLRAQNPMLLAQVTSGMPAEYRAQIDAELGGRQAEADGARIASLLQPVEIDAADSRDLGAVKRKLAQKDTQSPENMIAELQKMSATELTAARAAWDATHDQSWDELIAKQYEGVDTTTRLRIEAAARGDTRGERALRLRQGMRTFDQDLIDQALANPDLKSSDPAKRAAAEADRHDLEARMQQLDAGDQRSRALLEGTTLEGPVVGRGLQQQLGEHYERAKSHDVDAPDGLIETVEHADETDERMARIREKAHADRYAATELLTEGDTRASTKVRRAELAGDTMRKADLLEHLDSKEVDSSNTLAAQRREYAQKFGGRDMLANPDLSDGAAAVRMFAHVTGDERPSDEIARDLAIENMNVAEMRIHDVRETGVLADRTRAQVIAQQERIHDKTESGWLAGSEFMTYARGGGRGSEDYYASTLNVLKDGAADGVDEREWKRRTTTTTEAMLLQREEKQREADRVAQTLSIASKIAAILIGSPALFVAVDAGFSALRIAAQKAIANEAYEMSAEMKHAVIDLVVSMVSAKVAGMGKGIEAGTEAAKGVRMMQRVGTGAAAVGGAAAHAAVDGENGGAGVFAALVNATGVGDYVRDTLGGLVKGNGLLARGGRATMRTLGDAATNTAMNGGQLDAMTAFDAVGNRVQDHVHAHPTRRASAQEHAAVARAQASEPVHSGPSKNPHVVAHGHLAETDESGNQRGGYRAVPEVRTPRRDVPMYAYETHSRDVSSVFAHEPSGDGAPHDKKRGTGPAHHMAAPDGDGSDRPDNHRETPQAPTPAPDPADHVDRASVDSKHHAAERPAPSASDASPAAEELPTSKNHDTNADDAPEGQVAADAQTPHPHPEAPQDLPAPSPTDEKTQSEALASEAPQPARRPKQAELPEISPEVRRSLGHDERQATDEQLRHQQRLRKAEKAKLDEKEKANLQKHKAGKLKLTPDNAAFVDPSTPEGARNFRRATDDDRALDDRTVTEARAMDLAEKTGLFGTGAQVDRSARPGADVAVVHPPTDAGHEFLDTHWQMKELHLNNAFVAANSRGKVSSLIESAAEEALSNRAQVGQNKGKPHGVLVDLRFISTKKEMEEEITRIRAEVDLANQKLADAGIDQSEHVKIRFLENPNAT